MNTTNWPEGIKKTKQREAIWSVLTTTDKPITAMEIAERLGDGSTTWMSTIYRTLELLETKDIVTDKVKDIYDENLFNNKDVYKTSVGTERQDELFEYANVPSYMKQPIKSNYRDEIDKDDDFDIGF